MAIQKGTGFTNLNRILQANKGNKLGQTVSSGIQQQVQGTQSQVKSAQQQFEEEAQKNRLDTGEAAKKRQDILSRFAPQTPATQQNQSVGSVPLGQTIKSGMTAPTATSPSVPITPVFAQSESLNQLQQQNEAAKQQLTTLQGNLKTQQDAVAKAQAAYDTAKRKANSFHGMYGNIVPTDYKNALKNAEAALNAAKSGLAGTKESLGSFMNPYEAQYNTQLASEQAAFNAANQPQKEQFVAPTEQEIQDFTKYRTGTYTGPKELQDITSLYGRAQQVEQLGDLSRSEGGRQELLRRFVGGKDYTTGQRQLDATILGQQPGALGSAARQARGATQAVEEANLEAANLAQEYVNRAKGFGEETTKMVGETKTPISTDLDTRVKAAEEAEKTRVAQLKSIQDMLTGAGDFGGLDQWTRSGLALQEAADRGILSNADLNMLLGGNGIGLLQRGANIGLDMNKLINERLTNTLAQNIGRKGMATDEEIAKLNALDRLSGKQGADLEFLEGQGKFAAGKTGFNVGSLEDYIKKSEAEKARKDKAFADKLAAEQARYMNQLMAGYMGQIEGGMTGVSSGLNSALNPQSYYNPGEIAGNLAGQVEGATQYGTGLVKSYDNLSNATLEGLLKLNIGGKSIANTEGGRQLLKAIELKNKLTNTALGTAGGAAGNVAQGIKDLASTGSWDDAAMRLSGLQTLKDITSQLRGGDVGRVATNVGRSVGSAVKKAGKAVKKALKSLSDENVKTNIEYDPKDLQRFMDRLKPAAYDYKKEVQDSPLASKNRELGVMAQDLEKSKLGKEAVQDTKMGKVVDYDNLEPKMLASIAALNKRLKELENKK